MDEPGSFGMDDFSIEMGEYEIKQTEKFGRFKEVGPGGTICNLVLAADSTVYFGSCNHNVYALKAGNGELAWKFRTQGIVIHSSPLFWEGRIYVGSLDYNMYCLDAKTGRMVWKHKTEGGIASTPCIEDGMVFFGSCDQNAYCLDALTGRLVWKFKTSDEIAAAPSVHKGRLFIGSFDRNLYCLDTANGRLIWKFETQGQIHNLSPVPVHDGVVYIASFDNNVYAIDEANGQLIWKFRGGSYGSSASPVLYGGFIYHVARDGIIFKLTMDGRLVWKFVKNEMISIPLIHDDRIYVGCEDNFIYCVSLEGRELWKFETQGPAHLRAAALGGMLFFPNWDCNLYCLDEGTHKLLWKFTCEGSPSYMPPAFENFELVLKVPAGEVEEDDRKQYGIGASEEAEGGGLYKSRITYQVRSRYQEKGKYQTDGSDEEF